MASLKIIGAGLAGVEAAWQAARCGLTVELFEMRPHCMTAAHRTGNLAELVCSNSLRGTSLGNAVGLLKEELRLCGSLFMQAADQHAVPAGGALAVDREAFSAHISEAIENHPRIRLVRQEIQKVPEEGPVIIASGPLTSAPLAEQIGLLTGTNHLYFYDAIAPIVEAESIDYSVAFAASRYGKGGADYLNCPLDKETYLAFVRALRTAKTVMPHDFEKTVHFEGCLPIEILAERGEMTLAYGPMKPVGLRDPKTGDTPYAVVQLRQDDRHASLYNMVGFQTKLVQSEQRRIFRTIPGLGKARFARLGSMHRNTYINSPACLNHCLQLKSNPRLFFAGQITGVEGYVESAACGLLAGIFAAQCVMKAIPEKPPDTTALGALLGHVATASETNFQPMNINYGLFPPLINHVPKRRDRREALAARALLELKGWLEKIFDLQERVGVQE